MGRYRLVNKTAKEVVDVQDNLTDMEEAKEYFYFKKALQSRDGFERLYEVKEQEDKTNTRVKF